MIKDSAACTALHWTAGTSSYTCTYEDVQKQSIDDDSVVYIKFK